MKEQQQYPGDTLPPDTRPTHAIWEESLFLDASFAPSPGPATHLLGILLWHPDIPAVVLCTAVVLLATCGLEKCNSWVQSRTQMSTVSKRIVGLYYTPTTIFYLQ